MKEIVRTIQLTLTAREAEVDNRVIDEARFPEIEAARKRLALLKGAEVIEGLAAMRRSGLPLTLDLRPAYTSTDEEPKAKSRSARPTDPLSFRRS